MPDVSDDALRAIAHPGRRAMLRLVWDEERAATELAEAAECRSPPRASTSSCSATLAW